MTTATAEPSEDTFERMSLADLVRILRVSDPLATEAEVDRLVELGLPRRDDGTYRFAAVLAWIEERLGDIFGAKRS